MPTQSLKVMVLAGGPDRERPVSLLSGAQVAVALKEAGHQVMERDISPSNVTALKDFQDWGGQVIFPVLHGAWGEGGGLQRMLDAGGYRYVGSGAPASELCMDKHHTKMALLSHKLPTPAFEFLTQNEPITLEPPLVIKPPREGSSIDLIICRDLRQVQQARSRLSRHHPKLLIEQFIKGKELTVGVISSGPHTQALPPIQIVPATEFYDYEAKYTRDDTQYLFDIDLPAKVIDLVKEQAVQTFHVLGCRHMARVDFMVDEQNQPWILEVNTIPGFTTHSLLPKAAAHEGIPMTQLVDHLVHLAAGDDSESK